MVERFSPACQSPSPRVSPPVARCRSSVVEHPLGKGEVPGSRPGGSTIAFLQNFGSRAAGRRPTFFPRGRARKLSAWPKIVLVSATRLRQCVTHSNAAWSVSTFLSPRTFRERLQKHLWQHIFPSNRAGFCRLAAFWAMFVRQRVAAVRAMTAAKCAEPTRLKFAPNECSNTDSAHSPPSVMPGLDPGIHDNRDGSALGPWMRTDRVRGLKAHGSIPGSGPGTAMTMNPVPVSLH